MRLGIMQPYFFPYMGHFSLIAFVDQWVVFDVTQYTPKTWMNRNRILHPKAGWQYVTVPLSNSSISIQTSEAKVLNIEGAKKSILGKLTHYKKSAPYFRAVNRLVTEAFDSAANDSLVSLNSNGLRLVCEYLEIPFSYQICSELKLEYPADLGPGDWAPYICEKLGANEYLNPVGGSSLFDPSSFSKRGIDLFFAEFMGYEYSTTPYSYEPGLSIIDALMWNSPTEVKSAIIQKTNLTKAT